MSSWKTAIPVTVHCPNTGSMKSCWHPGAPVLLSHSDNPARKLSWTLECIDTGGGWIGVNTTRVNAIIARAIEDHRIPPLDGYRSLTREPRIDVPGFPPSRFDLLLTSPARRDCFVEIKNTTLLEDETVLFPDAVSERGRKHLELLAACRGMGRRSVILFAVNRPEGRAFAPAAHIDPAYAATLESVHDVGVEIVIVRLRHDETRAHVAGSLSLGSS